jgi:SEC-C motif
MRHHLIDYGRNKLNDPILMGWALRRYERAQGRDSDLCRSMEEAWFHDLALRRWIDSGDHEVLEQLLRILPPRLFAGVRPEIVDRWGAWAGGLGVRAVGVLMECPLETVLPLIARHIENNLLDLEKTAGVIGAITDLPSTNASQLLDDVTARLFKLEGASFTKRMLLQTLLRPTAVVRHENLVRLIETCARATPNNQGEGRQLLLAVYSALFDSDALRRKASELTRDGELSPFRSLQTLFRSGAPLDECDRILFGPDPWPDARNFLAKHRAMSPSTGTAFATIEVMQSLNVLEPADMACFAIGAVLHGFELDEIDVSDLSIDEALNVLAQDLSDNRHSRQLTRRLGSFPPRDLARAVAGRMPAVRNEWGGMHLAAMAGELRLVDMIPMLIDSLDQESGDFLSEAAAKSLVQIGEPAELALIAKWDALDDSQKLYGGGVLETIGGERTCRFAVERFQELFRNDHHLWCELAEAVPDRELIEVLEPETRREQPVIDECFYRLCVLTGYEPCHLVDIRERVMAHRQRVLKRQAAFATANFRGLDEDITLTLKCERCGDVNDYEVKSLITTPSNADSPRTAETPYFVGDDLRCASCRKPADFEFTNEARMQVIASLITYAAGRRNGKGEHQGPLRPLSVNYRWETRPAPEVMAELQAAVAEDPQNIVNQLRLARLQSVLGRRGRAEECYSKALEIEQNSMEAGLGIAKVMAETGRERRAFDKLSDMLRRKLQWRFFRTDEVSPQTLIEDFVRLFNQLRSTLGVRDTPLLQMSSMEGGAKIGRNERCPCGSGKKYKKCCGVQASIVR